MKVTFNKAAYLRKVPSLEEAAEIYRQFLDTYMALEIDKRITNKVELCGDVVDISIPITYCGNKVYDLRKMWGAYGPTLYSKLLSMLNSFASTRRTPDPHKDYILDGEAFKIPADDNNSMLISLVTHPKYKDTLLEGITKEGSALIIRNIATPSYIEDVGIRIALGIRIYEHNPKHKPSYTSMGNGDLASPMDLLEAEAQELLNHAVSIEGEKVLYATMKGRCYAFREHEPGKGIYHGYLVEKPSEKVQRFLKLK